METFFRLFMYVFPYAISLGLYTWLFRRSAKVPHKTARIIAMVIIGAGAADTLYQVATTIGNALTDDRFHFAIIIITIIVGFLAAIAMAFGEPEK